MNNKFIVLICLFLFIFTVSSVSATDANQTVTKNVLTEDIGTFSELQDIISNTEEGSIVNLDKDYAYDEDNGVVGIIISDKNITINGNGHTLDGNHTTRVFDILDGNVVLNNILFVNGKSSEGGAIYSEGHLEINDCIFIDNAANHSGGAICAFHSLNVNNCTFINNVGHGGAIRSYDADVSILDSLFLNNSGYGGAVEFVHDFGGSLLISNSVFNDNVAYERLWLHHSYGEDYTDGVVSLESSANLADNQISVYSSSIYDVTIPFPNIAFSNVSFNGLENQSFNISESDYMGLDIGLDNKTIRFEVYDDDELLINTTNTTVDGIAKIDYGDLIGYDVYLNVYYGNLTDSALLRVKKDPNFTMSVDDIVLGDDLVIKFNISHEIENYENATAVVEVYDPSVYNDLPKYYSFFNLNGNNITIPFPYLGNFTVNLYFDGDESFISSSINQTFNVYNVDYNLTGNKTTLMADALYKRFGGDERLYISLSDENDNLLANKTISIDVNGVKYSRTTDKFGQASMAINLPSGYYRTIIKFEGDDEYLPIGNVSEITIYPTVDGYEMSKYVGVPGKYSVECTDSQGNKLTSGDVKFNINGVMYYRAIDEDGLAGLNINLAQGTYIITATNPVTGEMQSGEITVLPTLINNHDLVKYYRNDSQFTVDLDGPFELKDQTVTFNINGVMYERKTNENGTAKLNINLAPGEYVITSMFNGCMVSNKITVLPILEAEDLEMYFEDGSTFDAMLLDGQGYPLANEFVVFNINGVFYDRITDDFGIARLNINLMDGEYIITSSYNGCNISNKITISS